MALLVTVVTLHACVGLAVATWDEGGILKERDSAGFFFTSSVFTMSSVVVLCGRRSVVEEHIVRAGQIQRILVVAARTIVLKVAP